MYNNSDEISNTIFISSYNINSINIYNKSDIEKIKKYLLNNYNIKDILYQEFKIENILISLSTIEIQKANFNKNKTSIDLGECENIIKLKYNISENDTLFIFKIDYQENGMKIPKIEYELYYPLYSENLILLNLSICENIRTYLSIPVSINGNIDMYNSSSSYYNDFCYKITTESGTDISLKDRKNNFINNNLTLCEENCDLIEYNYTIKKAKCSCLIKISLPFIDDIKFDKNKFLKNFIDINNIANIQFLKCYKKVFISDIFTTNYGFYIYTFIIIIYFLCLFLFYKKYFNILLNEIDKISIAKNELIKLQKKYNNILSTSGNKGKNNIINTERKKTNKIEFS